MAFTGIPVITAVNDRTCRITDISLAASATGTIGFAGSGADIELPASFIASSYTYQAILVDLSKCLGVLINPVSAAALTNLQPSVQFSGTLTGTNPASLRISVINTNSGSATQTLSIEISHLGGGKVSQPGRLAP